MNLQQSNKARYIFFSAAAFLTSYLLTSSIEVLISLYLWLIAARLVIAALITFLPRTSAGSLRPYSILTALTLLALTQAANPHALAIDLGIIASCLLLDTGLDGLLISYSPKREWPKQMILLILARTSGLFVGLILHLPSLEQLIARANPNLLASLILLCLFTLTTESSLDSRWKLCQIQAPQSPAFTDIISAIRFWTRKSTLSAYLPLVAVSIVSSSLTIFCYPIAVLSSGNLATLLAQPNLLLAYMFTSAFLLLLIHSSKQEVFELIIFTIFVIASLLAIAKPSLKGIEWVTPSLFFLVCLDSYKLALLKSDRVAPYLRAALPITLWCLGALIGEALASHGGYLKLGTQLLCLSFLLPVIVTKYQELKKQAKPPDEYSLTGSSFSMRQEPGRHGDRIQDFTNVTPPTPQKKSYIFQQLWQLISVRLPVFFIFVISLSAFMAGALYSLDERQLWKRQTIDSWKTIQTQLFLVSLKHRLEEEMLASKRIPSDWAAFIAASFQDPAKKLSATDFWGHPLAFETLTQEIIIISAGPDAKFSTSDDIEMRVTRPQGVF